MWHEGNLVIFLVLAWVQVVALAQGSSSLFTSYVPLAVRSPYLGAWLNTTDIPFNVTDPFDHGIERAPSRWPLFFNNAILGWAGLVRVDNETFMFLGNPGVPGNLNRTILTNIQLTPTRTMMNVTAGPVDVEITWLSPIEPTNLAAQSLPFSYMSVQVRSNDGQSHFVQVYSDISAEWSSGDRGQSVNWDVVTTDQIIFHEQVLVVQQALSEKNSQALDATTYWGMQQGSNVTYMADTDANCRQLFTNEGTLANSVSSGPGIINKPFVVYAISKDLATVGADLTDPVIWAVGMLRNPAVSYLTPGGTVENRRPYWAAMYNTPHEAITAALLDTANAFTRSAQLDSSILQSAAKISTNYADLVSVSARQAMAGLEVTVSQNDTSDVMMFMKDIGASSSVARVTPVEVLYSAFPSYLFINASYGGYLLKPLLELSNSSHWTFDYAPQDLGTHYPNATGNLQAHNQEVEQTGNMLIMTLAHARASGDGSLISKYYDLLRRWGEYLVSNSLPVPSTQLNADQLSKANSTNLAIKGIIGIQALSQMSKIVNRQTDADHYATIATTYANTWKSLALSTDTSTPQHILSNYGSDSSSWVLAYNLFADKWLQTNLIPDTVYSNEEAFLTNLIAGNTNGLSIVNDPSSPPQLGNTAWTLFTAATVNDSSLRDSLISPIWTHLSHNLSGTIFPTKFNLDAAGAASGNTASPGVGGLFAPLALTIPQANIVVPAASETSSQKKKTNVGAIVGGVIAGVVGLGIIVFLGFFFWRRSRPEQGDIIEKTVIQPNDTIPQAFPYNSAPYEQPLPASQPTIDAQSPLDSGELGSSPVLTYPSSKARLAALSAMPRSTPPASSSSYSTSDRTASSREPPSTSSREPLSRATSSRTQTTTSPISPREVQGLRMEVENLRRVMQSFQNDRFDPPPEYDHT